MDRGEERLAKQPVAPRTRLWQRPLPLQRQDSNRNDFIDNEFITKLKGLPNILPEGLEWLDYRPEMCSAIAEFYHHNFILGTGNVFYITSNTITSLCLLKLEVKLRRDVLNFISRADLETLSLLPSLKLTEKRGFWLLLLLMMPFQESRPSNLKTTSSEE